MTIDMFSNTLKMLQTLPEPWVNANRMFAANVEKMLAFHMNTLESYLGMSMNQLRAAAEVHDVQSFQDFCGRQAQVTKTMRYRLMNEMRTLPYMGLR